MSRVAVTKTGTQVKPHHRESTMWEKFFRKAGFLICLILFLLGVFPTAGEGAKVLRFGVLPVVDTLPLFVGEDRGFFRDQGIELEIISFQSALERDAALQAGKLDGYFGDILNTLLLIRSGQALGIMTTAFQTHPDYRMFALVSAPESDIRNLAELKGKQVAISRATIIEYLLDRLLAARDKRPEFVEKQEIKKMAIRLQMLMTGRVPAALLPEPLVTLAETKGAHVVMDDRVLDTALTVLALKRDVAEKDASLVRRFLRAYGRAVEAINSDPESCKDTLVTKTRFPAVIREQYRIPQFPTVGLPRPEDLESAQTWLIRNGLVKTRLHYDQAVLKAPLP